MTPPVSDPRRAAWVPPDIDPQRSDALERLAGDHGAGRRILHHQERCIAEVLFKSRAHGFGHIAVKFAENTEELVDHKSFLFGEIFIKLKHIECHRPSSICWIKIYNILKSILWNH